MIDPSILNIGSSKWNKKEEELDKMADILDPSQFMLPAVENVILVYIHLSNPI